MGFKLKLNSESLSAAQNATILSDGSVVLQVSISFRAGFQYYENQLEQHSLFLISAHMS